MQSSAVQVDPHLGFLGSPIGHLFLLVRRQTAALWLQKSPCEGLLGWEWEDGSLKTQARVRLQAEGMVGPLYSA